jgi:hypothetical protein
VLASEEPLAQPQGQVASAAAAAVVMVVVVGGQMGKG